MLIIGTSTHIWKIEVHIFEPLLVQRKYFIHCNDSTDSQRSEIHNWESLVCMVCSSEKEWEQFVSLGPWERIRKCVQARMKLGIVISVLYSVRPCKSLIQNIKISRDSNDFLTWSFSFYNEETNSGKLKYWNSPSNIIKSKTYVLISKYIILFNPLKKNTLMIINIFAVHFNRHM